MIPTQNEMFQLVLKLVEDLPEFTRGQAKQLVCEHLKLTNQEQNEKTNGTSDLVYSGEWNLVYPGNIKYIKNGVREDASV